LQEFSNEVTGLVVVLISTRSSFFVSLHGALVFTIKWKWRSVFKGRKVTENDSRENTNRYVNIL